MLFVGGHGNDTITIGSSANLIGFNRGDGQDTLIAASGASNTLSLGGGITYSDLSFSRLGADLVLDAGNGDQITLKNWYQDTAKRSVVNLQMIIDASADFAPGEADSPTGRQIERFEFSGLAARFEEQLKSDPTLGSWQLAEALTDFHLSSSDSEALGGDLAYRYGHDGSLAGIGLTPAQEALNHPQFGTAPQALQPIAALQTGRIRLA